MPKLIARRTTRIIGITALAASLKVGRQHIYKVAAGERKSSRIQAALEARGIKCKPYRR